MKFQKIKFRESEYIIVNGAITTPELFTQGKCGFAHLDEDDGLIRRFNTVIGNKDDIEIIGEVDIDVDVATFLDGLMGETWPEDIRGLGYLIVLSTLGGIDA